MMLVRGLLVLLVFVLLTYLRASCGEGSHQTPASLKKNTKKKDGGSSPATVTSRKKNQRLGERPGSF